MELGKGKLRSSGVNNLQNAVHRQHGLIWTDGKGIYLAPVQLKHDQTLDNAASLRLGEFESVQSVHWSCGEGGGGCYMAAVHQSNVTVWHVSGSAPRLAFKQVRKISVQPIAQGCLWNPRTDVLCLLSRQQCSFYFRHMQHSRGSFAFPSLENGKISCGCWSPDGRRLVLCVGTALLIYTWTDIEASINDFVTTAWRIPGVLGDITAIVAASDTSMVCVTALPLEALCVANHQSGLAVPGGGDRGVGAEGIMAAQGTGSGKDSILNMLQTTSKTGIQDAATLSVVQLRSGVHDPQVVTSTVVPALLSPDLLHFQVESQCAVVGSSSQGGLQVFALLDDQLVFATHLTLGRGERPIGLCGLPTWQAADTPGVLALVGKTEAAADPPTFPSSSSSALFSLSLVFLPTRPDKARQRLNGLVRSTKTTSSAAITRSDFQPDPQTKSVSDSALHSCREEQRSGWPRPWPPQEDSEAGSALKLSVGGAGAGQAGCRLVEDITDSSQDGGEGDSSGRRAAAPPQVLETETVEFSQSAPKFRNSALARKYDMNWNEDAQDGSSVPSGSAGVSRGEVRTQGAGKPASQLSNGHAVSVDTSVPGCVPPSESPERSVADFAPSGGQGRPPPSEPHADRGGKRSEGDVGSVSSSVLSNHSSYNVLEKQIQSQRDQISALQKRVADLSTMVEETACVFPAHYQTITEPECVTVQCAVGGRQASRRFLLDNGRLQLDPVKQAFGLLTLELILDGEPLVLGANIDGYIPMKFSPDSQLQVTGIPLTLSPPLTPRAHRDGC